MSGYQRGKPLAPEFKRAVVLLKEYFDRNRGELDSGGSSVEMAADALEIGSASVRRIMAAYNKSPSFIEEAPKARGRPLHAIGQEHQESVRRYIRKANQNGNYVTLEDIAKLIQDSKVDKEFHVSTLARALDRWGFVFGKGTRSQHLKEKDHVIAARRRYLRRKLSNRSEVRTQRTHQPEVFLDESYVNKNHSNDLVWYSEADGPWIQKPTGKGERLIIVNAITDRGWVPNARLVYKASRRTGDYHGQMNWEIFKKWFEEKLVPNIPPKSLIIMDNASYHNILAASSAPTANSKKDSIKKWLLANKAPCSEDSLKSEMIELLMKLAPEPTYAADEIAEKHGHEILRTPPYHPELQPIEICWGVVKNQVARNCDFTMSGLISQLDNAFESVTAKTCQKIIRKVTKVEDQFWREDEKLDEFE